MRYDFCTELLYNSGLNFIQLFELGSTNFIKQVLKDIEIEPGKVNRLLLPKKVGYGFYSNEMLCSTNTKEGDKLSLSIINEKAVVIAINKPEDGIYFAEYIPSYMEKRIGEKLFDGAFIRYYYYDAKSVDFIKKVLKSKPKDYIVSKGLVGEMDVKLRHYFDSVGIIPDLISEIEVNKEFINDSSLEIPNVFDGVDKNLKNKQK